MLFRVNDFFVFAFFVLLTSSSFLFDRVECEQESLHDKLFKSQQEQPTHQHRHQQNDKQPDITNKIIDLHTHTTFSDGTLSAVELIKRASQTGITTIAITDHDQLLFSPSALALASSLGIRVIEGVEISCEITFKDAIKANKTKSKCHLLGYFTRSSTPSSSLDVMLSSVRAARDNRNELICDVLKYKYNIDITVEQVRKYNNITKATTTLGRPHIARTLVGLGYSPTLLAAFTDYLSDSQLALPDWSANIEEAIINIHKVGGVAVLAHPGTLGISSSSLEFELSSMLSRGVPLGGIEVYSSKHSEQASDEYYHVAQRLGLLVTGGSDFHGSLKENAPLGSFGGGSMSWLSLSSSSLSLLDRAHTLAQLERDDDLMWFAASVLGRMALYGCIVLAVLWGDSLINEEGTRTGVQGFFQSHLRSIGAVKWLCRSASLDEIMSWSSRPSSATILSPVCSLFGWLSTPFVYLASKTTTPSIFTYVFCFLGLQLTYVSWGYLQERIMTVGYSTHSATSVSALFYPSSSSSSSSSSFDDTERFKYTEFLVFMNRLSGVLIAGAIGFLPSRSSSTSTTAAPASGSDVPLIPSSSSSSSSPSSSSSSSLSSLATPSSPSSSSAAFRKPWQGLFLSPPFKYILCSVSNILSSWFQYECLRFVSFPLQVLSKSSKVVATMTVGTILHRHVYKRSEYAHALVIALGICLFRMAEAGGHSHGHGHGHVSDVTLSSASSSFLSLPFLFGVLLLIGYVVCDSFTSTWQGEIFKQHRVSSIEMMFAVNVASSVITLVSMLIYGNLAPALAFCIRHHDAALHCIIMSACSGIGQLFIFHTISTFGAVAFATMMTVRQMLSLALSISAYNHQVTWLGFVGLLFVFLSLFTKIRGDIKQAQSVSKKPKQTT